MEDKDKEIRILQRQLKTTRLLNSTLRDTIARQEKTIEQSEEKYTKIGEEKEKLRQQEEMKQNLLDKAEEKARKKARIARQKASKAKAKVYLDHLALGDDNCEKYLDALSTALKYLSPVDSKELLENWLFIHSGDRTKLEPLIYSIANVDKLIYKGAYGPVKAHVEIMSDTYQKICDAMEDPDTITETQREKFNQMVQALKKKYDGPCDGMKLLWDISSLGRLQFSSVKHMKILLQIFQKVHQDKEHRERFSWADDDTKTSMMKVIECLVTVTEESPELNYTAIIKEVSKMFLGGSFLLLNALNALNRADDFLKEMWNVVYSKKSANSDSNARRDLLRSGMAMLVSPLMNASSECFIDVTVSFETTPLHHTTVITTKNYIRTITISTVATGEEGEDSSGPTKQNDDAVLAADLPQYTRVPIEEEDEENEENEETITPAAIRVDNEEKGDEKDNTNEENQEDNTNNDTTSSSKTYKVHKLSCHSHTARCNYMCSLDEFTKEGADRNPLFVGSLYQGY